MPVRDYDLETVFRRLDAVEFCALNTLSGDIIGSRFMGFVCEPDLSKIYLVTPGASNKVKEAEGQPKATLTAFCPTNDLHDDHTGVVIHGEVAAKHEYSDPDVERGLELFVMKNSQVKPFIDAKSLFDYVVLVMKPTKIGVLEYQDALKTTPACTIAVT